MWRHPEIRTLPDIVRHWSARTPDKIALSAGDVTVSYRDLDVTSSRIANAVVAAGVPTAAHVGYLGKNTLEFWQAWFGVGKAGCGFVPLNWRCPAPELAELVNDARPAIMIVEREFEAIMNQVKDEYSPQPELVVFDSRAEGGSGLALWTDGQSDEDPKVSVSGQDVALLAYTSGTTGRPKGARVTHEAFSFSFLSDELEPTITWSADDLMLAVMPNFHLAGSWVPLPALYHNATIAIEPAFEPTATLAAVAKHRPTQLCLVPAAMQALLDHPNTSETDFASLRTLIYAGSPIGSETVRRALTTFACDLRQFYGTTETYIISILRPAEHDPNRPDMLASCGSPVPLVDVRLVDVNGDDVETGVVGEVLVRSPMVFAGYFNQPHATAAAFRGGRHLASEGVADGEGWYATGDLGYRDADGVYYLVDRAKDMVVTGGENVYSVEVEQALQRHRDVAVVAVIGTPDERWGEAVTAYVVPVPGATPNVDALRAHCRELIAGYKVPKAIHVEKRLPTTPTGKVQKAELRKMANEHRSE